MAKAISAPARDAARPPVSRSPRRPPAGKPASAKPAPAKPGAAKPRLRDPQRTRALIQLHATREFSAKGFSGARVDGIAARCKLSKNTLYYYFGSKEGLFVAVLEAVYERLLERQAAMHLPALHPDEAVRQLVAQTFAAFRDMPEAIRLLNEENLHRARHVRRSDRMRPLYDGLIGAIAEVLERGREICRWRAGIDPVHLYLSVSSMAYHYLSNRHTLQIALARDISAPAAQQAWVEHITTMVLAYCRLPQA